MDFFYFCIITIAIIMITIHIMTISPAAAAALFAEQTFDLISRSSPHENYHHHEHWKIHRLIFYYKHSQENSFLGFFLTKTSWDLTINKLSHSWQLGQASKYGDMGQMSILWVQSVLSIDSVTFSTRTYWCRAYWIWLFVPYWVFEKCVVDCIGRGLSTHWLMIFTRTWSMTKKPVTTNLSAIMLAISPKTFFFTADHVLMVNVNYRETFHVWGNVPLNRCWWRPMLALDLLSLFTTAAAVEDIGHHLLLRTPACPLFHNQVHFSTLYLYLYLCLYFVLVTKFQINWYRRQPFLSKCLIRKMWKGVN